MSTAVNSLAGVAIVGVLGATTLVTLHGERDARLTSEDVFSYPLAGARSLKVFDWSGDGVDDVFVQGQSQLAVLDARGSALLSKDVGADTVTTLTDVDGDGRDDLVTAAPAAGGARLGVVGGSSTWSVPVPGIGAPQRITAIPYETGTQLVVMDGLGHLAGVKPGGAVLWRTSLGAERQQELRGLDAARVGKGVLAIVATRDGTVAALDSTGLVRWAQQAGGLRRMRAFDLNGDGETEIAVGGDESGQFLTLSPSDGRPLGSVALGQPQTEVRETESDGNPASREIAVGGKKGGVWALTHLGAILWTAQVGDKVSDLLTTDVDGDGKAELLVSDESGQVTVFAPGGARLGAIARGSTVARLDTGALGGPGRVVIADAAAVSLVRLAMAPAPLLYSPLVAGVVVSLLILFVAWFVNTLPARTGLRVTAVDESPEALVARRRMLHGSLADVERVRRSGAVPPEAYLARVRALREELATTETAMARAGLPVTPQVFSCPHCGAPLQVGANRCDFCAQPVIV